MCCQLFFEISCGMFFCWDGTTFRDGWDGGGMAWIVSDSFDGRLVGDVVRLMYSSSLSPNPLEPQISILFTNILITLFHLISIILNKGMEKSEKYS